MVVVQLVKGKITGNYFYIPVNGHSTRMINLVNWGTSWFSASQYNEIKAQLEKEGETLNNKWYHRQRLIEPGFVDLELYELA